MDPTRPELTGGSVICSQCGGENDLPSGQRFVTCAFCDATVFVDRSAVVSHYRVPPLLEEHEAKAALRRWMAGNDTVKDLDRKSTLESVRLISFPVWLFRTSVSSGERVFVEPAAPTPLPQVADLQVPAGRLESYDAEAEGVESVEVTVPLDTARGWLEQRGVDTVRESALVRVPLWQCHYRFDGQTYLAMVDASTGAVLAANFPEKAESPYLLVAALGLVLFGLEGLLITNLAAKFIAYVVTAVPLTLLAYWVANRV